MELVEFRRLLFPQKGEIMETLVKKRKPTLHNLLKQEFDDYFETSKNLVLNIHGMSRVVYQNQRMVMNATRCNYEKIEKFLFRRKSNTTEFGYYPSEEILPILYLVKKFNIRNYIEFGSGLGLYMKSIQIFCSNILPGKVKTYKGFENEEALLEASMIINPHSHEFWCEKKDILNLEESDIKKSDRTLIFYWQPFVELKETKMLLKKLVEILPRNSVVVAKCPKTFSLLFDKYGPQRTKEFPEFEAREFLHYSVFIKK